jgi:hypothetical protein
VANILSVFVSSACDELRDLRAAVPDVLESLGINPQLSEDPGFPRTSGDKPYVTCLSKTTGSHRPARPEFRLSPYLDHAAAGQAQQGCADAAFNTAGKAP